MICPETDNGASPHDGFTMRNLLHHLEDGKTTVPQLPVPDLVQESGNAASCRFGFVFGHDTNPFTGVGIIAHHHSFAPVQPQVSWRNRALAKFRVEKTRHGSSSPGLKFLENTFNS